MFFIILSVPLVVATIAFFLYPSYSEGKQLVNGGSLYANQEPKLKGNL